MPNERLATLIPLPQHVEQRSGELVLRSPVGVAADGGAAAVANLLCVELSRATGLRFEFADAAAAQIVLRTEGGDGEHYRLEVDAQRAV
ncbi:MAG: glycoside hydrolase family 20 zincin-like fold domain-containing protein, partial [Caldilinea sp.]